MEVVEVLRGDFGDLDVVNVHFLLFDEVEQEVERTFEEGDVDFVGRGHGGIVYQWRVTGGEGREKEGEDNGEA